jgi:DNA-binding CsgD family transcriptional regulator
VTFAEFMNAYVNNGRGDYAASLNGLGPPERYAAEFPGAWILGELTEAAARSGEDELTARSFALMSETTQASGADWGLGVEARCRALMSDKEEVDDLYRAALDHFDKAMLRTQTGRTHVLYGEWLRRGRRRVEAREHLRAALDLYTEIGAEPFIGRAERELLATGEKVRKRTVATANDLTPQEAEVARLAADGHSNPEIGARLFISSKTVEYHLHKVFDKLDIDSRSQLARALPVDGGVAVST